jgi:two-component system, OmpR family, phosphate regulon sensor histidine kinase PhoR
MLHRNLSLIIILMILTVVSIGGLQWYWVQKSYSLQKEEFDQQVNRAINRAIDQLGKSETRIFLSKSQGMPEVNIEMDDQGNTFITQNSGTRVIHQDHWEIPSGENGKTKMIVEKAVQGGDSMETINITSVWTPDSMRIDTVITRERLNERIAVFGDVIEELLLEELSSKVPVQERLGRSNLDSLLSASFQREGLTIPYAYELVESGQSASEDAYTRQLFPYELNQNHHMLAVQFPNQEGYVLRSMFWLLAGSIGLILLTCLTFGALLIHIRNQKRVSQMKSDFLNNMTHEFKTPLATISLAVDSIKHPKTKEQPGQVDHFANIIMQENRRMNDQVERVLQVARLDRQETELQLQKVDLNELVQETVQQMKLNLDQANAQVIIGLHDGTLEIDADNLHLKNAIRNLLDNAVKYSEAAPLISIRTETKNKMSVLRIADQGIGMSVEQQEHVFEQFYRATTGNLHNTKGFGLGLYYVKHIVNLHGGEVILNSIPSKGTQIEIQLPLK